MTDERSEHELCGRCGYPLDGIGHDAYCEQETPNASRPR